MKHCFTRVRCAKPIVEAQQDGDQVIAVLRSALHRQPSTITASTSNDCIAPWAGAARLVSRPRVRVLCSVHAHGSWHKQWLLWHIYSCLSYHVLGNNQINMELKGNVSVGCSVRFDGDFAFHWFMERSFFSFLLTTMGIMVFIGCVDVVNLW